MNKTVFLFLPLFYFQLLFLSTVVSITVDGLVLSSRTIKNSCLWSLLYFVIYMLLTFKQFVLKIFISNYIK